MPTASTKASADIGKLVGKRRGRREACPDVEREATLPTDAGRRVSKPNGLGDKTGMNTDPGPEPRQPLRDIQVGKEIMEMDVESQNQRPRRAKANLHPGLPDVKVTKTRRSSAQVAADKKAALTAKSAKATALAELKKATIKRVAAREDQMVNDEARQKREAAQPPAGKIVQNVAKRLPPISKGPEHVKDNEDQHTEDEGKDKGTDEDEYSTDNEGTLDPNQESQVLIYRDKHGNYPRMNRYPRPMYPDIDDGPLYPDIDDEPPMSTELDHSDDEMALAGATSTKINKPAPKDIQAEELTKKLERKLPSRPERAEIDLERQITPTLAPKRKSGLDSENDAPAKKAKRAYPVGLLSTHKDSVTAPTLWAKVNAPGSRAAAPAVAAADLHDNLNLDTYTYGGLEDEDESEEAAAKPAARVTNPVSVTKITRDAPAIKVENLGKPSTRFSASDLPADIKAGWSDKFCPLWRNYLGTLTDPWDTDNPMIKSEMQICFNAVYPDSTYGLIRNNDVVHYVAMQRFYDWRGKFAKRAVAILNTFFDAQDAGSKSADDQQWRKDYAKWALGPGLPFLYAAGDPSIKTDAYQSSLILKIFFSHLADTAGAPEGFLIDEFPSGALMLSITAAERALSYFKSGTTTLGVDKGADKFSEANWYQQTKSYGVSVGKIGPITWGKIVGGAREAGNAKAPAKSRDVDERAQISDME